MFLDKKNRIFIEKFIFKLNLNNKFNLKLMKVNINQK